MTFSNKVFFKELQGYSYLCLALSCSLFMLMNDIYKRLDIRNTEKIYSQVYSQEDLFLLFEAIVNGIIFLISLSDSSLLAYKNATDFWIVILYPAALLSSFICSSSFLWDLQGSLSTVSYQLQIQFYFFLSSLGAFHFSSLSDCCGQDFQHCVEEEG